MKRTSVDIARGLLPALPLALSLALTLLPVLAGCDGSTEEPPPPPPGFVYHNDDFVPEVTGKPTVAPTSLAAGDTVNVYVPVDTDTTDLDVSVGPYLLDGIVAYGSQTSAVTGGTLATVSVPIDSPSATAGTYRVRIVARNATPSQTHYNPYPPTGTYGIVRYYNGVQVDSFDSGIAPTSFTVTSGAGGGGGGGSTISTTFTAPSAVTPGTPSSFFLAPGATGYLTFSTAVDSAYGVYINDAGAAPGMSSLSIYAYYDNAGTPVQINAEGRYFTVGFVTSAFKTGPTPQTYVVEVDNSGNATGASFDVTVYGATLGGASTASPVPVAVNTPVWVGGDSNTAVFEFTTAQTTAQVDFSLLTAYTTVTIWDSGDNVIAGPTATAASGTTVSFSLVDLNLTPAGPPFRIGVVPTTVLTGVPSVGQVTITTP